MDHVKPTHALNHEAHKSIRQRLRSWLSNAGGFNWRSRRFAGNLDDTLGPIERLEILHSLIGVNGTRHTTESGRNSTVVKRIVDQHFQKGSVLRMIDVGCSGGVDSRTTFQTLSENYVVGDILLADKYVNLLQSEDGRFIFDEDGVPLQRKLRRGFVSFHFATPTRSVRIRTAPQRLLVQYLKSRVKTLPSDARGLSLIDPALTGDDGLLLAPYRQIRFDAFETTLEEKFEVVVCLHLLIPRYFSEKEIERGRNNLLKLLAHDGILIMGDVENPEIWHRHKKCSCMVIEDV